MDYEKNMIKYLIMVALAFLIYAKKPQDFGKFVGKVMAWWCSPLLFIVCIVMGYIQRNKLRWFKKKYVLVSINQCFKFLIFGMTGLTKRYG